MKPPGRHTYPRAWIKDRRECKNCGHRRDEHGGNVGRGRFGSSVFCIHKEVVALSYPGLVETGGGATIGHPEKVYKTCGCRTFEAIPSE